MHEKGKTLKKHPIPYGLKGTEKLAAEFRARHYLYSTRMGIHKIDKLLVLAFIAAEHRGREKLLAEQSKEAMLQVKKELSSEYSLEQ
jgi:hypothetical protein